MDTWTLTDSYEDGDARVHAFACGCEVLHAPTYNALFPCSAAHTAAWHADLADGRAAA